MRLLPNSEMVEKGRSTGEMRPAIVPQMVQADGRNSQGNDRMRKTARRVRLPHGWDSTFLECAFERVQAVANDPCLMRVRNVTQPRCT
jgi:hypothetical protein